MIEDDWADKIKQSIESKFRTAEEIDREVGSSRVEVTFTIDSPKFSQFTVVYDVWSERGQSFSEIFVEGRNGEVLANDPGGYTAPSEIGQVAFSLVEKALGLSKESVIKQFLEGEKEIDEVNERDRSLNHIVTGLADMIKSNFSHLEVSPRPEFDQVSVSNQKTGEEFKFSLSKDISGGPGSAKVKVKYKYFPDQESVELGRPRNPFTTEHSVDMNGNLAHDQLEEIMMNMQEQYQMGV